MKISMRHIYKYLVFVAVFTLFSGKGFSQASPYGVSLSGMEWGTGNIPGTAGSNYFLPTAQEFTYYKGKGLKLFRIPFLWERMQESLGGSLNSTYLSQLDGVVSAATSAGVSVFLDCHNYARYNGNVITSSGGPTQAQFDSLWTKLAAHYAGNTTVWGYDIMNEPHDLGGVNWQTVAQATVNAIRKVDQGHTIIIEGDNWSHGSTWTSNNNNYYQMTDPNNNLVFEAHQYFDSDGSGNYTNNTVAGNGDNEQTGVTLITPFVNWCTTNKVKGMVGEYGIPNDADQTNWNTLLTNFLTYLQTNCIMGTYWAGGPAWGTNPLSCEPTNNYTTDASQMSVLENFTSLGSGCANSSGITVSISSPSNNTTVTQGANVTLTATASVTSGSITQVAFYYGSTLIGTATSSPYTITWNDPAYGNYQITAIATNSALQTATSSAITVNVIEPVYSTTTAPTIDGVVDALWSNYQPSSLNNVLTGTVSSSTYLSANWQATWDANNLYILVVVQDDVLVNTNQPLATIYNDDGIEIYIDMGNTKTTSYGSNQFRYTFRWNDPTVYELQHSATTGVKLGQTSQGITAGCTTNCAAQGYTMEVAIPWSTLGASAPAIGNLEGFDVAVNDDDNGTRDAKIAWNMTTDNDYQDPALFGTIIMEGAPCTPPAATITSSSTSFCPAGSVTLNANTGTGFTYQWNSGGSPISGATNASYTATAAASYTVTVKNSSNCPATSSPTTITASSAPSATITAGGATTICTGSSVTLNANTGTGLTYQWKRTGNAISGATNASYSATATGAYTLTVTNSSNCSATSAGTDVTENAAPTTSNAGTTQYITTTSTTLAANTPTIGTDAWSIVSGTGSFTNGSSATTTISGLSTGANQLEWSITNTGVCPASTSTVTINVGTAPTSQTVTGQTSVTASEQGVTYSVPYTAGTTYSWSLPIGATIASTNANGNQITVDFGTTGGSVAATETNPYGSANSSLTVSISGTTAVIGSATADSYEVYPNPFNSSVTIRVNSAAGQLPLAVTITDLKGVTCYNSSYYTNENIVVGEQLSSGVYIVQLVYANQANIVKLVKMQ